MTLRTLVEDAPRAFPSESRAVASKFIPGKTRRCQHCGTRRYLDDFPRDKHRRPDSRMCLVCIDEHTPQLMSESDMAKWLGITIAEVRELAPAGDYSPPKGAAVPLYAREQVSVDFLPPGWRTVIPR